MQRARALRPNGWRRVRQYNVGEVRLRMGDLDGAAEAFDRAYEFGHDASQASR